MDHLEIEVKFFIDDSDAVRQRIKDLDATLQSPRTFEYNARYDTENKRLLKNKCLLRLRKDSSVSLTFKSPPPSEDSQFKIYREQEVTVSDFKTMEAILTAMGYRRYQVYQKWRETWSVGELLLCLDTMPFGSFLELEGPPAPIRRVANELGLNWENRILPSYMEIFEVLKKGEGLSFTDVTFDNFAEVNIPFEHYQDCFAADIEASE